MEVFYIFALLALLLAMLVGLVVLSFALGGAHANSRWINGAFGEPRSVFVSGSHKFYVITEEEWKTLQGSPAPDNVVPFRDSDYEPPRVS